MAGATNAVALTGPRPLLVRDPGTVITVAREQGVRATVYETNVNSGTSRRLRAGGQRRRWGSRRRLRDLPTRRRLRQQRSPSCCTSAGSGSSFREVTRTETVSSPTALSGCMTRLGRPGRIDTHRRTPEEPRSAGRTTHRRTWSRPGVCVTPPATAPTATDASSGGAKRPTARPTPPPQPIPLRPRLSPVCRTLTLPSRACVTRMTPSIETCFSLTRATSFSKSFVASSMS